MTEEATTTSREKWSVHPLVVEALKLVWKQQDELKRQENATAVAERLSGKEVVWHWVVRDQETHTVLKVFSEDESSTALSHHLCDQYRHLEIIKGQIVWRWVARDKMTNTVLKVFPTKESMEPFLDRLRYQHGPLEIKQERYHRSKNDLTNVNHLVSSGGMH
jgi:hypothetical protein